MFRYSNHLLITYILYYRNFGKCFGCHQDNTGLLWCHPCNAKQFQNEFDKWTSEDREIDKFIQQIQLNANKCQEIIELIPFDRLENVTYLAKGGFGTVYKANWLDRYIFSRKKAIAIYGITKNPTKNEYMMVMIYAKYGSLRNLLERKIEILLTIVNALTNIHEIGLMHKDFCSGNIVNQALTLCLITDFGLCKPVSENDPEKIFGVIPFMAPETLSRGEYTQASDIYSFDMVMLEVLTSYSPYYNISHDVNLAMKICEGEIKKQVKAANKFNKNFIKYNPNKMHPEAIYTNSKQQFFSITDNIIVEDEENETQEMEYKFNSLGIN
ncbi:hypothetical protein Glove_185g72 [Diversispora epigaea]|uniref:Protein kinase domain-containing protein n=1 Tax=Diversispora epigaea TaxID=1348612 RepID=A0A397IVJ2_9GLOM|nr:hypothetical protein Glove_185g72 [Diversispora epigaea]